MADHALIAAPVYTDGSSFGADLDGCLAYEADLSIQPFVASSFRKIAKKRLTGVYWDGTTQGVDQDGMLVWDPSTPEAQEMGCAVYPRGVSGAPYTREQYLAPKNNYDEDGAMDCDGDVSWLPPVSIKTYKKKWAPMVTADGVTAVGMEADLDGLIAVETPTLDSLVPKSGVLRVIVNTESVLQGTSWTTATGGIIRLANADPIQGQGLAFDTSPFRKTGGETEDIQGQGLVSDVTAIRTLGSGAEADIEFTAEAEATEAFSSAAPGIRTPWAALDDLSPTDRLEPGCLSSVSLNNTIRSLGSANFERNPAYSGLNYVLGGPANDAVSPKRLGFRKGDRIRLIGSVGTEPQHGMVFTLQDPDTFGVFESVDPTDTEWYQFLVFRSVE